MAEQEKKPGGADGKKKKFYSGGFARAKLCIPFSIPVPAGRHFSESAEFRGISGFRRNTRLN